MTRPDGTGQDQTRQDVMLYKKNTKVWVLPMPERGEWHEAFYVGPDKRFGRVHWCTAKKGTSVGKGGGWWLTEQQIKERKNGKN